MKLLPSPSISSTSTASFDANICTSKSGTANCLTGILRRILCSRSLPTYPSDQTTETSSVVCYTNIKDQKPIKSNERVEALVTNPPGVVARLMGLESLPDQANTIDPQAGANSISRSRSLNSVEFRGGTDQMQGEHRRVKSTLSFREMPTFLELENEDYIVLCFENIGGGEGRRPRRRKQRKCEVGNGDLNLEERREKYERKENRRGGVSLLEKNEEEERINKMVLRVLNEAELSNRIAEEDDSVQEVGNRSIIEELPNASPCLEDSCEKKSIPLHHAKKPHLIDHRLVCDGVQPRRKQMKKKNNYSELEIEDPECSSHDSSPVSVLDFGQFVIDPEPAVPTSEEDTKSGGEYNSRRKLSTELDNHSRHIDDNSINDDRYSKRKEDICRQSGKKSCHSQEDSNMWEEICRVAETELLQSSNWIHRGSSKVEDLVGICTDFEKQIFDELLEELMDQFRLICHEE
ncbi:hypothetical protein Tsubulata_050482 [Turnera subulata]|uniref:DUF3741 domain-containing protein n=1 Tax=Turnera subulata TaxID=218843 RepID=A0A9Q0GI08_9ROSI|nr:hypothetical protein Tsubulata_050482 [Turnera subulata]